MDGFMVDIVRDGRSVSTIGVLFDGEVQIEMQSLLCTSLDISFSAHGMATWWTCGTAAPFRQSARCMTARYRLRFFVCCHCTFPS